MSKTDPWMPFYFGDYLRDTGRLSTEQHGAYLLLIADYWTNGSPPDDDRILAQITRLDVRRWKQHRPVLVAFFAVAEGRWVQKRVEIELERSRQFREKQQANGKLGGRPRKTHGESQTKPNGLANGKPNESLSQSQSQEEKDPSQGSCSLSPEIDSNTATAPSGAASLAFEGKIIRLSRADFDQWGRAYPLVDLPAVLQSRDDWLVTEADEATRKKWFIATSNHLANLQQRATAAKREAQSYDRDRITV